MEQEALKQQGTFSASIDVLKDLVNKWLQREHGSDDIDYFEE